MLSAWVVPFYKFFQLPTDLWMVHKRCSIIQFSIEPAIEFRNSVAPIWIPVETVDNQDAWGLVGRKGSWAKFINCNLCLLVMPLCFVCLYLPWSRYNLAWWLDITVRSTSCWFILRSSQTTTGWESIGQAPLPSMMCFRMLPRSTRHRTQLLACRTEYFTLFYMIQWMFVLLQNQTYKCSPFA